MLFSTRPERHLEADAVAAWRSSQMHAAVEADTEDGNAALAGRAAGRQGGRRATILLRHVKGADIHHGISSHKASAGGPLGILNSGRPTGWVSKLLACVRLIRIVPN